MGGLRFVKCRRSSVHHLWRLSPVREERHVEVDISCLSAPEMKFSIKNGHSCLALKAIFE